VLPTLKNAGAQPIKKTNDVSLASERRIFESRSVTELRYHSDHRLSLVDAPIKMDVAYNADIQPFKSTITRRLTVPARSLTDSELSNDASITPKGIPNATRLTEAEQSTAARLQAQTGLTLRESWHIGSEYVDEFFRTYDAIGNPKASEFWNAPQFSSQIGKHLLKSNDFTVIDLVGFKCEQIITVRNHVDSLPKKSREKIIRIGF